MYTPARIPRLSVPPGLALVIPLAAACGAGTDGPIDIPPGTASDVAGIVDEVMQPVISASATGNLDQCVGAVVAVVTPDEKVVRGYGGVVANGAPPDGDTLFQIGSISKVFTGLVLAREVAAGHMHATDPAPPYLAADLETPLAGATITLADLVTHHAGLPEMPSNLLDRDGDGKRDPTFDPLSPGKGYTRADLASYFGGTPPPSPAGYKYSNLSLGLLGLALEDQLGAQSYDTLLREHVLDDLGMHDTWGLVSAIAPEALGRAAQGYAVTHSQRAPGKLAEMGALAGAGEVTTTGNDAARLLSSLTGITRSPLDEAVALAVSPLAPSSKTEIEIGYGIEVEHLADGDRFNKGGATASQTAYLSFRRDPAVGVMVMTSCGSFNAPRTLATTINDRVTALRK